MLAHELISDIVTALKTSDSGNTALSWMEVFRIKHLPIVNHREFLGLLSDADIYDLRIPIAFDAPLGSKVEFHLHNHGYNTWTLLELGVER